MTSRMDYQTVMSQNCDVHRCMYLGLSTQLATVSGSVFSQVQVRELSKLSGICVTTAFLSQQKAFPGSPLQYKCPSHLKTVPASRSAPTPHFNQEQTREPSYKHEKLGLNVVKVPATLYYHVCCCLPRHSYCGHNLISSNQQTAVLLHYHSCGRIYLRLATSTSNSG